MKLHNHPGYTVPIPVTRDNPVPTGVSIERNPDYSFTAYVSIRIFRGRLATFLYNLTGKSDVRATRDDRWWFARLGRPAAITPPQERAA